MARAKTHKCPECGKQRGVFVNGVCQLCNHALVQDEKKKTVEQRPGCTQQENERIAAIRTEQDRKERIFYLEESIRTLRATYKFYRESKGTDQMLEHITTLGMAFNAELEAITA